MTKDVTPLPPEEQHPISFNEAKNWALFCHLSAFAGHFIPFGNIIAPLIIWLVKKADHPFVNEHGKAALNFQISILIYFLVGGMVATALVITIIGAPFAMLLFLLLIPAYIAYIIFIIIAAVKAGNGEHYEYPFTIRLLS